jgi:hypothetical protein
LQRIGLCFIRIRKPKGIDEARAIRKIVLPRNHKFVFRKANFLFLMAPALQFFLKISGSKIKKRKEQRIFLIS